MTTTEPGHLSDEDAIALIATALGHIAPEVDLSLVDRTAPLQDELDLDSMDVLNLVTDLGRRLGIDIPDRDTSRLASVDALAAYLVERAG
jgi:acyl carrier protein